MIGQLDASIVAGVLLLIAILARHRLPPRVRSLLLLIALVRLVLPPWIRSPWSGSLLGAMTNFPFPPVCQVLKLQALPESFRKPIISTLPALFISGSLDSNTPPYQAEEVRWGFPNSVHVIVENAGHESTLTLKETRGLMVDFLRGKDVAGRRVIAKRPIS